MLTPQRAYISSWFLWLIAEISTKGKINKRRTDFYIGGKLGKQAKKENKNCRNVAGVYTLQ